ncbi:ankyrin repeat-containing domain protein [Pterulicium gracile]|uniref:Ankyrin repeat-containing domain protein n=1 Tax=Pterulicium gracile TaxID=1884261 RepID=A0A5C3QUE5_9AGAR|nr:ankyrin repeat-containing domain protein [Pterula gracilis]
MWACRHGQHDMAEYLIKNGAQIRAKDMYGQEPIKHACFGGNERLIRLFLSRGIDVDLRDRDGDTNFSEATAQGRTSAVRLLLLKKASVNCVGIHQWTLMRACRDSQKEHEEVGRMLLNHGADWCLVDENGWRALNHACASGNDELASAILRKALRSQRASGRTDIDALNSPDNDGDTAVAHAALEGHHSTVLWLLSNNALVDQANRHGCTPLMGLSRRPHPGGRTPP